VAGCPGLKAFLVPNSAIVLRGIKRDEIHKSGLVKKAAFKPRSNGKDRDGLSTSIEKPELRELHRAKYESDKKLAVYLVVQGVRAIPLAVKWEPLSDDPAHSLITGVPGEADRSLHDLALAERYAELLALAAKSYTFPG
jgi:hypothetical protein